MRQGVQKGVGARVPLFSSYLTLTLELSLRTMITSSWSVLALAAVALASSNHQAPFVAHQLPNSHDPALPGIPGSLWNGSRTPRIAIIGAGAGGSVPSLSPPHPFAAV